MTDIAGPAPTTLSEQIAARIADTMFERNVSVRAMAEQAEMGVSTLKRRLAGRTPFLIAEVFQIASALGTDVCELFDADLATLATERPRNGITSLYNAN